MTDLAAFLKARLTEDEQYARAAAATDRSLGYAPARALREVAAKRAILGLHIINSERSRWGDSHPDPAMRGQQTGRTIWWCWTCDADRDYGHIGSDQEGCDTLRYLATVYCGHADYDPAWKPA